MTDEDSPLVSRRGSRAAPSPDLPPPEAVLGADPAGPTPAETAPRRVSPGVWAAAVVVVLVGALVAAGFLIRLPYYTIAPGDAVDVNEIVTVSGAESYPSDGEVLLLFVRQRAEVNAWRWLQASLDDDIDLVREDQISGDLSPSELRTVSVADMELSQISAKKVALEALGYDVPRAGDGVTVLAAFDDRPAAGVLERGDVILRVDGQDVADSQDLKKIIQAVPAGDTVEVDFLRDGEERSADVGTVSDDAGNTIIGVIASTSYDFPVDIELDTGSIGGPSAGLAMTLAIIDALTPGDLSGGLDVAVTGAIHDDGTVGEVGGVGQKAVAARAAGADLFLVPASEVADAEARAGDVPVVGVETLDDALAALAEHGGDPVQQLEPAA